MNQSIIGCILAALVGGIIAWINARLTAKAASAGTTTLSVVPVVRMLLSVGYLALVYFVSPYLPWDRIWMLAGACVGLTIPMFFFTFRLLKKLTPTDRASAQNSNNQKGGDS